MDLWESLGFKKSPYDASPLKPTQEDVELLVGRTDESIEFITVLESDEQGVIIISGAPGVGKTSFFNINQYLLETQQARFGPKLLAARRLCPIQPNDTARDVVLRALHALCRSTEEFCALYKLSIPKETKKVLKWINSQGSAGFSVGLEILGFGGNIGREVQIPNVNDISFEGLQDVIKVIIGEVVNTLKLEGAFIALDNIENLEDDQLADLLITFRDTLFTVPRVWWVLIGQSGLSSLIQSLEPRVAERMLGKGLELSPISLSELDEAIEKRVARFHRAQGGKAPLPAVIHERLYKASHGEIRFTFKYGNIVCTEFVKGVRIKLKDLAEGQHSTAFNDELGRALIKMQIPESGAEEILKRVVESELEGLNLKAKEKEVLMAIGDKGGARPMEFKSFGFKSMQDFSSNYLSKLHKQHLLQRQQQGKAVLYKLRGIASMAFEFKLF